MAGPEPLTSDQVRAYCLNHELYDGWIVHNIADVIRLLDNTYRKHHFEKSEKERKHREGEIGQVRQDGRR